MAALGRAEKHIALSKLIAVKGEAREIKASKQASK